ncbi:MAG: hypothetical protein S0880_03820 [Actinomycetota bacterium]|nr:hypothetical protein [Actinomycetota bacterium]
MGGHRDLFDDVGDDEIGALVDRRPSGALAVGLLAAAAISVVAAAASGALRWQTEPEVAAPPPPTAPSAAEPVPEPAVVPDADPVVELLLAARAHRREPPTAGPEVLREVIAGLPPAWAGSLGERQYEHVGFLADGRLVARARDRLDVFDVDERRLDGSRVLAVVGPLAVSPDGSLIATAGPGRTWQVRRSVDLVPVAGGAADDAVTTIGVSATAGAVVLGLAGGDVVAVPFGTATAAPRRLGTLRVAEVADVVFSVDGALVAASGRQWWGGEWRAWRTTDGGELARGSHDGFAALSVDDSAEELVVASAGRVVRYSIVTGEESGTYEVRGTATGVSVGLASGGGRTVLVSGGVVETLDPISGRTDVVVDGEGIGARNLAVDPSGTLVAVPAPHGGRVGVMLLSSDGDGVPIVAVPPRGGDGAVVWNGERLTLPDLACLLAGRDLTTQEWERHGPPGEPYEPACGRRTGAARQPARRVELAPI